MRILADFSPPGPSMPSIINRSALPPRFSLPGDITEQLLDFPLFQMPVFSLFQASELDTADRDTGEARHWMSQDIEKPPYHPVPAVSDGHA